MRSLRLVFAAATLLMIGGGVAGCGAGVNAGAGVKAGAVTGAGATAGAVDPTTWASRVCQSLAPWRAQIASLNSTAQARMATATTPQDTRAHLLALLDGGSKATEQARDAVRAAGVPDVAGGPAVERRFVASLDTIAAAYRHAYTSISALSTTDAGAFYKGVADAMATLNAEYGKSGVDTDSLASAQLRAGFDEAPGCR